MNITIPCTFSNFLTNQNLSKTSLVFWHIMTVVMNKKIKIVMDHIEKLLFKRI